MDLQPFSRSLKRMDRDISPNGVIVIIDVFISEIQFREVWMNASSNNHNEKTS